MTTTYIRSARSLHRSAGEDVVAMVAGEPQVHVLSGPAAAIWDIMGDRTSIEDATETVAGLYGRPADELRSSVEDCVRTLARLGLVEELDG